MIVASTLGLRFKTFPLRLVLLGYGSAALLFLTDAFLGSLAILFPDDWRPPASPRSSAGADPSATPSRSAPNLDRARGRRALRLPSRASFSRDEAVT